MDDPIVRDFMTAYAFICALLRESASGSLSAPDLRLLCRNAERVLESAHAQVARDYVLLLVEAEIVPGPEQFSARMQYFLEYLSRRLPREIEFGSMEQFRGWFVLPDRLKHEVRASIISSAQTCLLAPLPAL